MRALNAAVDTTHSFSQVMATHYKTAKEFQGPDHDKSTGKVTRAMAARSHSAYAQNTFYQKDIPVFYICVLIFLHVDWNVQSFCWVIQKQILNRTLHYLKR